MSGPEASVVRVEIVEIMGGGECPSGFKVGRTWLVEDGLCPQGMCAWAFNSILPFITTLRFNGSFPWHDEPLARVCCPDADNPVVFRLTSDRRPNGTVQSPVPTV